MDIFKNGFYLALPTIQKITKLYFYPFPVWLASNCEQAKTHVEKQKFKLSGKNENHRESGNDHLQKVKISLH